MVRWLRRLIEETFFVNCGTHNSTTKNTFCLNCCISICRKCVPDHQSHRLIQVRCRDDSAVVSFDDLRELINCSRVRTYAGNVEELMFLRPQPRFKILKNRKNTCDFCGNVLHDQYRYCSLTCKVEHICLQGKDISSLLLKFDASQITLTESKNLQTNVYDKPDDEVFDGDHNQITPDQGPIDLVQCAGSSNEWSLSKIAESSNKK